MVQLPPEVTMWMDMPAALTAILIVRAMAPVVNGTPVLARWLGGDKIVGLVLLVGIALGCAIEATTKSFDLHMAIRRTGFTAGMAALLFKSAKAYWPTIFRDTNELEEGK